MQNCGMAQTVVLPFLNIKHWKIPRSVCVCADKFETAPFEVMLKVCAYLKFHPTKKRLVGVKAQERELKQNKTKQRVH